MRNQKIVKKYLCLYPDGGCGCINEITDEVTEMVDAGHYLLFKFENNCYYEYLGEDGWEKVDEHKTV